MFDRLLCFLVGHTYSPKVVLALRYTRTTLETCDRCGAGDVDLALARAVSGRLAKADRP